tara:strand:- start:476 stop:718 length:243 start_codon:yes stop_codon:yes gene_type:complete
MKTTRIRQKIRGFLEEHGPQSTSNILDFINSEMRHGTTSQQLGNVLSKDKHFKKVGTTMKNGILSGSYEICMWDLKKPED